MPLSETLPLLSSGSKLKSTEWNLTIEFARCQVIGCLSLDLTVFKTFGLHGVLT